jgi:hypothetical protein
MLHDFLPAPGNLTNDEHINVPLRIGSAEVSVMPSGKCLGKAGLEGRGEDFKRDFKGSRG